MKKLSFFIFAFLFCSPSLFAQTDSEKWKAFSPSAEEFSVEVPGNLIDESFILKKGNRRYTGLFNGTYYFIFSDPQKEDYQFKTVLGFVEINQKNELEKQKQSPTMKFSFSDDENFHHTIFMARTENRQYVFHLISSLENDSSVERFFKSLKINAKTLADELDNSKTETQNSVTTTDLPEVRKINPNEENSGQGIGSGRGSGQGIGSGEGSGFGSGNGSGNGTRTSENNNPNTSNNENVQNKPLNITYKPRPQYTDFARFYNINGDVRVRTTFLKDGTIGATTPMTKLPFGLTKSALKAAKQIRFQPQISKGQSINVAKIVVYTFMIY